MNRINEFCLNSYKYALHENENEQNNSRQKETNAGWYSENHFYSKFGDLDFRF